MQVRRKKHTGEAIAIMLVYLVFVAGLAIGFRVKELTTEKEPEAPQVVSSHVVKPTPEVEYKTELPTPSETIEPETTSLGEFKLTAYCPCATCNGQWAGGPTATGTKLTVGRTIAVDPDVIPLGSTVIIDGAEYIAEDTGGAIKGNRIDVLLTTHEEAMQFGIKYADVSIKN